MKAHWLHHTGTARLILVFGGWALGPSVFDGLDGAQDVLFVEDYRDLGTSLPQLADYDQVTLLAYSFGVASAAHWLAAHDVSVARKIAVNGTLFPSDETRGIPPAMVEATAQGLSPASFTKFCRRAGAQVPEIDLIAAKAELLSIAARGAAPETAFDLAWIATRDRIVPPGAQRLAWSGRSDDVREMAASHQPFAAAQSWEQWIA